MLLNEEEGQKQSMISLQSANAAKYLKNLKTDVQMMALFFVCTTFVVLILIVQKNCIQHALNCIVIWPHI